MSHRPGREVIHKARGPQTAWWQASTVRIRRTPSAYPVAGASANTVAQGMTSSASRVTCSAR